jgi:COP9 signalosome complex subunit 1
MPWVGTLFAAGDAQTYAALCSLAALERDEVKRQFSEPDGATADGEGLKELVESWMGSRFRVVLEMLERYSVGGAPLSYCFD